MKAKIILYDEQGLEQEVINLDPLEEASWRPGYRRSVHIEGSTRDLVERETGYEIKLKGIRVKQ